MDGIDPPRARPGPDPGPDPDSDSIFSKPRPRPPRSPAHAAQIRAQNRRREYLRRHPSYLQSSEHEFADPLLYDFLIRRFQTPAEREADGRAKGYARVLEGSLRRGEARLARLRAATTTANNVTATTTTDADSDDEAGTEANGTASGPLNGYHDHHDDEGDVDDPPDPAGTTFSSQAAELAGPGPARTRAEGRARWEAFLSDRFVRGEDGDFDYAPVDADDELDVLERAEREEEWFEEEEPSWWSASDSDDYDSGDGEVEEGGGGEGKGEGEGPEGEAKKGRGQGRRKRAEKVLHGETGVQDF